jgi:hypothetical protein
MRRSSGTKPTPSREMRCAGRPATSWPFHTTRPRFGGVRPMIERMVVLLPTPLRPTSAMHCPFSTLNEIPNRTWLRP